MMTQSEYNNTQPLIGIDVGGTKIEAVLATGDGTIEHTVRIPTRRGAARVVEDVCAIARDVAGERLHDFAAVGIGIPGQVDSGTGRIANLVNLDIETLELGRLVADELGIPIHVENDVNAAAVGAAHLLTGMDGTSDASDGTVALLNFGTGLASGIIIDGVIRHGASGAAGEIGHIPIDPNRFDCPCGQRGCLETVCSGPGVARLWPTGGRDAMTDLIIHAAQGEPDACRALGIIRHAIGDAIQIIAQTLDPRLIILTGGMTRTGEPLLHVIRDELETRESVCPFLAGLCVADRLRLAPADEPIGALGAALAVYARSR